MTGVDSVTVHGPLRRLSRAVPNYAELVTYMILGLAVETLWTLDHQTLILSMFGGFLVLAPEAKAISGCLACTSGRYKRKTRHIT